jgi:hypothetical protein
MRAFENSNLRWNPFGEATFSDRRELALLRVAPLQARPAWRPRYRRHLPWALLEAKLRA